MKKYEKIPQFRHLVKQIVHDTSFVGLDDLGNPIYNATRKLPTLKLIGKVKLHGTNAGIGYSPERGIWAQKRNSEVGKAGHFGFGEWVQKHKETLKESLSSLRLKLELKDNEPLIVFGEWVGPKVQSGVAISQIKEKSFCAFEVQYKKNDEEFTRSFELSDFNIPEINCYYIKDTHEIEIDFSKADQYINQLIDYTKDVEKECLFTKETFGISGIGEGIVWRLEYKENVYNFKVKGEKHSDSKVTKLASVDVEKLKNIEAFVNYSVTEHRVEKMAKNINAISKSDTPNLIREVLNDIFEEEIDVLIENKLEKDSFLTREISKKARNFFFEYLMRVN